MAKSKNKYYVVWVGMNPGIYSSWAECQAQIKGFPNARYKAFKSKEEAETAFGQSAGEYMSATKESEKKKTVSWRSFRDEIRLDSISVDAACAGNPGIMEYRAVKTEDATEIFRMGPFAQGTNNIGEFLAIVHALAHLKKNKDTTTPIYTDSRTGLSWLRHKRVKTTLKKTSKNKVLFELIDRAVHWLKTNEYSNPILKWNTERWGEIPADFGRK